MGLVVSRSTAGHQQPSIINFKRSSVRQRNASNWLPLTLSPRSPPCHRLKVESESVQPFEPWGDAAGRLPGIERGDAQGGPEGRQAGGKTWHCDERPPGPAMASWMPVCKHSASRLDHPPLNLPAFGGCLLSHCNDTTFPSSWVKYSMTGCLTC